jgi:hypothetical protein
MYYLKKPKARNMALAINTEIEALAACVHFSYSGPNNWSHNYTFADGSSIHFLRGGTILRGESS